MYPPFYHDYNASKTQHDNEAINIALSNCSFIRLKHIKQTEDASFGCFGCSFECIFDKPTPSNPNLYPRNPY